jgi:hypothetical protein
MSPPGSPQVPLSFEQAERRFRELQRRHRSGDLDEETFHFEVAKLLLRDQQGAFWMLDADSGAWFRNLGAGWVPGTPPADRPAKLDLSSGRPAKRRRVGRVLVLGAVLIALLGAAAVVALQQGWIGAWNRLQPTSTPATDVRVSIASPADGNQVALGQVVAVESTIDASPDFQAVARVELQVDGQMVDSQSVEPRIQPDQTSLPLSQPWRPNSVGEHQVVVTAFSDAGNALGSAAITLRVAETVEETLPEPACIPNATFVSDVTIPPGTAFLPGVRMDKVWQVRNSGTCAWGVGYELVLLEGANLDAAEAAPVPPTAAGDRVDLAITFWAPPEVGTYASLWQLRSPDGQFFGPTLPLTIQVEILAEQNLPPVAPTSLQATVTPDGEAVQVTWQDRSDNEDAFRIYREDVEASIGLVPANAGLFVDQDVACGHTYRYAVVAFNAAGTSSISEAAGIALPPCAPSDEPPVLSLTVVPTQVLPSEAFTITFLASDDVGVAVVIVWGQETGEPVLDMGRVFTCTEVLCTASWPITWTQELSATLTLVAVARDSSGQESNPARTTMIILTPE